MSHHSGCRRRTKRTVDYDFHYDYRIACVTHVANLRVRLSYSRQKVAIDHAQNIS